MAKRVKDVAYRVQQREVIKRLVSKGLTLRREHLGGIFYSNNLGDFLGKSSLRVDGPGQTGTQLRVAGSLISLGSPSMATFADSIAAVLNKK